MTMDLKKIQDVDREAMFGTVFGVSGPGTYHRDLYYITIVL